MNIFFISPLLLWFAIGFLFSLMNLKIREPKYFNKIITILILFLIGFKGGLAIMTSTSSYIPMFISTLFLLVIYGFLQPFISMFLLKKFTNTDFYTSVAISTSFGSVSLMSFVAGTAFLDSLNIHYEGFIFGVLAIMEVPAIISGLYIARNIGQTKRSFKNLIVHAVLNKPIITILLGLIFGAIIYRFELMCAKQTLLSFFNPILSIFLLGMGFRIGTYRNNFKYISKSLIFFAIYMPIISAFFALILSYVLSLDVGTATLVVLLSASASYIAVPATMKLALPEANESIYLGLSLGITFPFNLFLGIPFYFYVTSKFFS